MATMKSDNNVNQYCTIKTYVRRQAVRNITDDGGGTSRHTVRKIPDTEEETNRDTLRNIPGTSGEAGSSSKQTSKNIPDIGAGTSRHQNGQLDVHNIINTELHQGGAVGICCNVENLAVILNNKELSSGRKNGFIDVLMNNNKNKLLEARQQQKQKIEDCVSIGAVDDDDDDHDGGSDGGGGSKVAAIKVDSEEEQDLTYSGESQASSEEESKFTSYYSSTNNAETSSIAEETDLTIQENSIVTEEYENFEDDNEHWYVEEPTWKYVWKACPDDKTKGKYVWTEVKNENHGKDIYWGNIRSMDDEWVPQEVSLKKNRWVPRLIVGKEHGKTVWYYMMPIIPKSAEARKRTLDHIPELIKGKGVNSWKSQLKFTKKGNKTVWYCKLTPESEGATETKITSQATKANDNNANVVSPLNTVVLPLPDIPTTGGGGGGDRIKGKGISRLPELKKITEKPSQWLSKLIKETEDNTQKTTHGQGPSTSSSSGESSSSNKYEDIKHEDKSNVNRQPKLQILDNITPFSKEIGLKERKTQKESRSVWYKDILNDSDQFS
ncbi:hypothetical protein Ahia01_000935200 [Argonauta hians]